MRVLAVDTSTPAITAGVAECDDSGAVQLLAEHTRDDAFGHAEHLMPLVRAALAEAGATLADVDAIVVGLGPGPFTGLRVGIATAAALADGLQVPVYGVGSHDAMAGPDPVVVATDARRREVHLSAHSGGRLVAGPEPIRPADAAAWLTEQAVTVAAVTGAGAELVSAFIGLPLVPAAEPLSVGLVRVAAADLLARRSPVPLAPLYLRRPDATEPSTPKAVLPS